MATDGILFNETSGISKGMLMRKMSKSSNNALSVDQVVRGVYELAPGYEFRDLNGQLVDWKRWGVWLRDDRGYADVTGYSVFLCEVDNPIPIIWSGLKTIQHPEEGTFWQNLSADLDIDVPDDVLKQRRV